MAWEEYDPEDGKSYTEGTQYQRRGDKGWTPQKHNPHIPASPEWVFRRPIPGPPQPDLREAIRELAGLVSELAAACRSNVDGFYYGYLTDIRDNADSIAEKLS